MSEMSGSGMLGKGLSLLVALGEHPDGIGVSDLAREEKIPVSTAHRLLASMVLLGFVSFDAKQRRYFLGLKVFELSHKVSLARGLSEIARPVMRTMAETTGDSVLMTVLDGTEMLYIERVDGWHRLQIRGAIGERGPLYCTSLGKSLSAFLPEEVREAIIGRLDLKPLTPRTITDPEELRGELELTRQRGYAVADGERDEGVRAVGAPVFNSQGWPVAAISIAGPVPRLAWERIREDLVPLIRGAAQEIGIQLPQGGKTALGSAR